VRTRIFGFTLAMIAAAICLAAGASASSAKTVWLCRPGAKPDPCTPGLSTTVYTPAFKQIGVQHPKQVKHPAIDCFYVYPTVSDQKTGNANLQIDPEERSIALYQTARYSQYCNVYAPMYRQETIVAIGGGEFGKPTTTPNPVLGYDDVQNAFETYLHKYNHGRGFILIGHSQGSFVLRELIAKDVDPKPAVRKLLVSAILMGGNVVVKKGTGIGGDFKHIPACRSNTQIGCVIAFSTFDQPPPSDSLFGHPVNASLKPINDSKFQVLCTNPAALAGGSGLLDPISPSAPFAPGSLIAEGIAGLKFNVPTPPTTWWSAPGSYSAQCVTENGATVLMIKARDGAQTPTPSPTPAWGLHLLDANIALGNLISIVSSEARAFVTSGR
jgi:Protein of unknown function (DUF3089)